MYSRPELLDLAHFLDDRGSLTKCFSSQNTPIPIKESFYSHSHKDVIRGMHFQIPPHDHEKIIHVITGEIRDVLLDIRKNSPTFGECFTFILSEEKKQALFIPKGFAHGFHSLKESTVLYLLSTTYHPPSDQGIRYDSFGYDWGINHPTLSKRDLEFLPFKSFASTF